MSRRLRSALLSLPLFVTALALSCTSDKGSGPGGNGGQGGDDSSGTGSAVEKTLSQKGGKVATANVSLVFPPGALGEGTKIKVAELSNSEVEDLPVTTDGVRLAGVPAKFTPHGLSFAQPVDVQLSYDEPEDDEPLVVMKLDDDEDTTWQLVPSTSFEAGKASFKINGFSCYGVFADPNRVAAELYGEDAQGSGGSTGSGGGDSGGRDSGGSDSGGGSSGGGSSGGSAGNGGQGTGSGGTMSGSGGHTGMGGTVGADLPAGYIDAGVFHGFGYITPSSGAGVTTSNIDTAPGPNCVAGFTGPAPESVVTLFYRANQDMVTGFEGDAVSIPQETSDTGVWIGATTNRALRVELHSGPNVWCSPSLNETTVQFFPWQTFNANACGLPLEQSFDPAEFAIDRIAVTVLSNGQATANFSFCIDQLTSGVAPIQ